MDTVAKGVVITPVTPAVGAEITGLDLSRPLDGETAKLLEDAWYEHILLLFRGQDLTVEQQVDFATTFGELGKRSRAPKDKKPGDSDYLDSIMMVTNIMEDGKPVGSFGDGEMWFHQDTCYYPVPNKATMLYAMELPSWGGNTRVNNMYLAYDRIPRDLRDRLEGRTVLQIHDYKRTERIDPDGDISGMRHHHQPIFITHPVTKKKALYVNRLMSARIDGLDRAESDDILARLFEISEAPDLFYEHEWKLGDLLMWDNRCSIHARTLFPKEQRRLLRRCTVKGEAMAA
jgi:taurine dioxygenase